MIIYRHTNMITKLSYIGLTKYTIEQRLSGHVKMSEKEECTTSFHKAIREYGVENFKSEILEHCQTYEDMCEKEKYWIKYYDTYNVGYNMNNGGGGFGKQESIDKFRNTIYEQDENGECTACKRYKKRNITLFDKNENALKEIGVKSSITQKENGKNAGVNNPRFIDRKILLINKDGQIMDKFYAFEIKNLDKTYPKRMISWSLLNHKPMYTFNKPRKNIDEKFYYSIACYEDDLYCDVNINTRQRTIKELKAVDTEKLDAIDKCIEAITHNWRFVQGLTEVFGPDYEKTLDRKRISEYLKWISSDTIKEESLIIADYGFEPKDVLGKVSQKAKEYFFAVENGITNG